MTLQAAYMEGVISSPMQLFATVIEETALFSTLFPDADTKRAIYFNTLSRPEGEETLDIDSLYPFILITTDQPVGSTLNLNASNGYFDGSGSLDFVMRKSIAELEQLYPTETTNDEELLRVWDNLSDEFIVQISQSCWGNPGPTEFCATRFHQIVSGRSSEKDRAEIKEHVGLQFKVDWGVP